MAKRTVSKTKKPTASAAAAKKKNVVGYPNYSKGILKNGRGVVLVDIKKKKFYISPARIKNATKVHARAYMKANRDEDEDDEEVHKDLEFCEEWVDIVGAVLGRLVLNSINRSLFFTQSKGLTTLTASDMKMGTLKERHYNIANDAVKCLSLHEKKQRPASKGKSKKEKSSEEETEHAESVEEDE